MLGIRINHIPCAWYSLFQIIKSQFRAKNDNSRHRASYSQTFIYIIIQTAVTCSWSSKSIDGASKKDRKVSTMKNVISLSDHFIKLMDQTGDGTWKGTETRNMKWFGTRVLFHSPKAISVENSNAYVESVRRTKPWNNDQIDSHIFTQWLVFSVIYLDQFDYLYSLQFEIGNVATNDALIC